MNIILYIKKKHPWTMDIMDFIKNTIPRQLSALILLRKTARDNEGEMSARAASSHKVNFCQMLGVENAKDEVGPLKLDRVSGRAGPTFIEGSVHYVIAIMYTLHVFARVLDPARSAGLHFH